MPDLLNDTHILGEARRIVTALERVAEAARGEVESAKSQCGYYADVKRCYGPDYKRTCTDCLYEHLAETAEALAALDALREGERE